MFDKKTNIDAQEKFGAAASSGNVEEFDNLVAPDCVDNDPAPDQVQGPAGFKKFFTDMHTAFPDMDIAVETMVAEDDKVAFAYTLTGTNTGPFQGNDPTGKSIKVRGLQISRFTDGMMVERWGSSDELGIMTQLGLA